MKRTIILLFLIVLLPSFALAQKVGVVLSGGGAKGMTHIGVIRALEENQIPIDYITGTSMGAIVGSLYAMGYTPDEMVELLKSDEFKRWSSGEVEDKYIYYFKKNRPTPELFNIRLNFKDSLNLKPQIIPTSFVDPIQMNLVFIDLYNFCTFDCPQNDSFKQMLRIIFTGNFSNDKHSPIPNRAAVFLLDIKCGLNRS